MRSALASFLQEAERLKTYLRLTEQIIWFGGTSYAAGLPPDAATLRAAISQAGSVVFQTSFDGALLTLAAGFQDFVAAIVESFLEALPSIVPRYGDLPERIRLSNESYTGEALSKRSGPWSDISSSDLVRNLYNCHQGEQPYLINAQAIAITERNFSANVLADYLSRIGIQSFWDKVSRDAELRRWASDQHSASVSLRARAKLDEFVTDRNNVAHRRRGPLVGPSTILSYIEYFGALTPAIVRSCEEYALTLSAA